MKPAGKLPDSAALSADMRHLAALPASGGQKTEAQEAEAELYAVSLPPLICNIIRGMSF